MQVYIQATRPQIRRAVLDIPKMLAGRMADPGGVVKAFQLRLGAAALSRVKDDFVIKSRGGVGSDGIKWPPLSPVTLALRRNAGVTAKLKRLYKEADKARQYQIKRNYQRLLDVFMDRGEGRQARKHARFILEKMKADLPTGRYNAVKRLLEQKPATPQQKKRVARLAWAGAFATILHNTGTHIFNALSPGVHGPSGHPSQIFLVAAGAVIVGVKGIAVYHHSDKPRKKKKDGTDKLPQRSLWPTRTQGTFTKKWWEPILDAAASGMQDMAAALVRNGRVTR